MGILTLSPVFCVSAALAASPGVRHREPQFGDWWQKLDREVADGHPISVRFALKQSGLDELKQVAQKVSNPRHPSYGQYLSPAEVHAMTEPLAAHVTAVENWLHAAGVSFWRHANSHTIEAQLTAAAASALFHTSFFHISSLAAGQHAVRAGDYWLPAEVDEAVAAVYGLHGLPAPPREEIKSSAPPAQPPAVTPSVIASTYKVAGVKPSGSTKNRQAVAEFQGQQTSADDLTKFFKQFVPDAPASDAKIHKFVGDSGQGHAGTESELDIETIMGIAPGLLSEFWYWGGQDFCGDLKNWTDTILKGDAPLVHSVSYGWQGPLSQLGCQQSAVEDVDANFVKLAAQGISIIIASGDSGSGYVADCSSDATLPDTGVSGHNFTQRQVMEPGMCCQLSNMFKASAWTFTPPSEAPASQSTCSPQKGTALSGDVVAQGSIPSEQDCCTIASSGRYPGVTGYNYKTQSSGSGLCSLLGSVSGSKSDPSTSSSHVTPPKQGTCTLFNGTVTTVSKAGVTAGGSAVKPVAPKLYPSWPASSPWVTSVGATRFINQKVGQPEMASDQFGSGGGFSTQFPAFKEQVEAVNQYLRTAQGLPPKGSFPPGGRATPDVSALGEGYQVIMNGQLISVGGTSASTPAFAGLVSLLNEARLNAGKKPMGYLNPFLYQNAEAFTDITAGTNAIGRGTGPVKYGFQCAKGWDPATGLGTPIFSKLMSAAMASGGTETSEIVV